MTDSSTSGNGSPLPHDQGDTGHPMKHGARGPNDSLGHHRWRWLLINVVLPVVILQAGIWVVWALGSVQPAAKPPDDPSFAGRLSRLPSAEVTQALSLESIGKPLELRVDGVVVPYREVQIATEVAGRIVKKTAACEAGNLVRKGDLLVEIDDTDYQQEVERLTRMREQDYKALGEVDQEIVNTKRLVELATQDVALQEREVERLASMPAGFASQGELDRAKKALLTATQSRIGYENQMSLLSTRRSRLEAAERLATTELRSAEINLERTKIYSPVDGVVVQENAELNSFMQRGSAIITLEDISKAEVAVNLRMDQLQWVLDQRRDQPAVPPAGDTAARDTTDAAVATTGESSEAGPDEPSRDGPNRGEASPAQSASQLGYSLPPTPAVIEYELAGRGETTYRWKGTLVRYDGIGLDPRSRTVPVVVVVDQPRHFEGDDRGPTESSTPSPLVRGMFVSVKLQIRPKTALIAIPSEAIQPGNRIWQFIPDDSVLADSKAPASTQTEAQGRQAEATDQAPAAEPAAPANVPAEPTTTGGKNGFRAGDWQAGRVVVRQPIIPVDSLWLPLDESEIRRLTKLDEASGKTAEAGLAEGRSSSGRSHKLDERRYWVCEVPGNQVKGGDWIVNSPLGDFESEISVRVRAAVLDTGD